MLTRPATIGANNKWRNVPSTRAEFGLEKDWLCYEIKRGNTRRWSASSKRADRYYRAR